MRSSGLIFKALASFSRALIESVEKGTWLVDTRTVNGEARRVQTALTGRRLKYEYNQEGQTTTVLEMRTEYNDIEYTMQCSLPSEYYPSYEDLCLTLADSLYVLHENADAADRLDGCRKRQVLQLLYESNNGINDIGPDYSPDGKRIAYLRYYGAWSVIYKSPSARVATS